MHPATFHKNERVLSPPDGRHKDLSCLRVVDMLYGDTPATISCWELTEADLELIKKTGRVYLAIMGRFHPPVTMAIAPEELGLSKEYLVLP